MLSFSNQGLGDTSPCQPIYNTANVGLRHLEDGGKFNLRVQAALKHFPHKVNVCIRYVRERPRRTLAMQAGADSSRKKFVSFLGRHIRCIFSMSPKEQMAWVAARRVIAGMANKAVNWIYRFSKKKRHSVSEVNHLVNPYVSVSIGCPAPAPLPTLILAAYLDMAPKFSNLFIAEIRKRLVHGHPLILTESLTTINQDRYDFTSGLVSEGPYATLQ